MPARTARRRARAALARLIRAEIDNDSFRYEAAAILREAIGFDWWCWPMYDPGARLPTRDVGTDSPPDQAMRQFFRLMLDATLDAGHSGAPPVTVLSVMTSGDLHRDLVWREMLGPAGAGDVMSAPLIAGRACWAQLEVGRDRTGRWFGEDDAEFLAEVAPVLAARLRDGIRTPRTLNSPCPEPGTIFVDGDLSLVAATEAAWRWIDRLGMRRPNDAEPLPGFIYAIATRAAMAAAGERRVPHPIRVRLQTSDGRWAVARVASLAHGPKAGEGYAITLEAARSEDMVPLLMQAWNLTPREREVARLVIDGLSTDDISAALFISPHTVRDHLKAIFGKVGVSSRGTLSTALAGEVPAAR